MVLNAIPMEWIFGLIGGLMIGIAAAILLLGTGRIMGASGIAGSLLEGPSRSLWSERVPFMAALIIAPALLVQVIGAPEVNVSGDLSVLVVAGLLVGFGTRLANGCTSGHGVCGMSRFSIRSIVSTLIYLAVGVIVYFLARHIAGVI